MLEDYLNSGYSIKDYCYINDDIDEALLTTWLQQHNVIRNEEEDDGFMTINIIEEPKKRGRPKQQFAPSVAAQPSFARIGDIELYYQVPAAYLKSLKA